MRRRGQAKKMNQGCLVLFGIPFLGAGIVVLVIVGRSWSIYLGSAGWAEIPATIEHAELESHRGDDGIVWKLMVKARALPVSLKVEFDLPVFAVDEADVRAREEHADAG